MVILLNGAFGSGKTTVARLIARRLPATALFDPELIGFVLQRSMRLAGRECDDFQDLSSWRRLVVLGIRATRIVRTNVIVPMAFSNPSYLEEIRSGIARFEPDVVHFCLVAPLEVLEERLNRRAAGDRDRLWLSRRSAECCVAHRDAFFAEHLPVLGLTATQVADQLLARLRIEAGTEA